LSRDPAFRSVARDAQAVVYLRIQSVAVRRADVKHAFVIRRPHT
jgi:hypothetical protein